MAAELMLINPRHKRRRTRSRRRHRSRIRVVTRARRNPRRRRARAVALQASTPVRRSRRRYGRIRRFARRVRSSGYIGRARSFTTRDLVPAGIGALGALGSDIALGYLTPVLPPMLAGVGAPIVRIGLAWAVGKAAGMAGGNDFGNKAMMGALTVTMYDLIKGWLVTADPAIFGSPAASQPQAGTQQTGLYVDGYGNPPQLNYYSPAVQVGEYLNKYVS